MFKYLQINQVSFCSKDQEAKDQVSSGFYLNAHIRKIKYVSKIPKKAIVKPFKNLLNKIIIEDKKRFKKT